MGNQLARTTQVSPSDYYLHDLPNNVVYKATLGGGRFLKTVQCVHDEGLVVAKVYFKRGDTPTLKAYERRLAEIRQKLADVPLSHVWPFQRWVDTDKAAYLVRQYFYSNLYDRISTRPFLTVIEKKWLAFQLLHALAQSHDRGVCHGDLKCENVQVTSWSWVYLADFASFKPTYLPADNPADFSFFFDTGGRRRCYIAPERFFESAKPPPNADAPLQPAMDIFSLGCVIGELFLEGQPLFTLSQLLQYRNGLYDPALSINKIHDPGIRALILHMIQLDPDARFSAQLYLDKCASATFPSYFSYLHEFFGRLAPLDADTRIAKTQESFQELCQKILSEKPGLENQGELLQLEGPPLPSKPESAPIDVNRPGDVNTPGESDKPEDVNRPPDFHRTQSLPQEPRLHSAAISVDTGQLIADISNILGSPNKTPGGSPSPPAKDLTNGADPGASPKQLWPRSVSLDGPRGGGRYTQNGGVGVRGQRGGGAVLATSILGRDGAFIVDERPDKGGNGGSTDRGLPVASRLKSTAADAQRAAALAIGEVVTEEVVETQVRDGPDGAFSERPFFSGELAGCRRKEDIILPREGNWTWEGDWAIDFGGGVDNEGWQYRSNNRGTKEGNGKDSRLGRRMSGEADFQERNQPAGSTGSAENDRGSLSRAPSGGDQLRKRQASWSPVCTTDSLWRRRRWVRKRRRRPSFPVLVDDNLPSPFANPSIDTTPEPGTVSDGMVIVAALLCACVRSVRLAQGRRTALSLLKDTAMHCDDIARLQRITPFVAGLVHDPGAAVRCAAVYALADVLAVVRCFPLSDAQIFPEYIFPTLSMLPGDPEESVRIAYADSIPKLASAAQRFLACSQHMTNETNAAVTPKSSLLPRPKLAAKPPLPGTTLHFETELINLREAVARVIQELVTGPRSTSTVRAAILRHVSPLCTFFGRQGSHDFLLPLLITFLNDRDDRLRAAFFEQAASSGARTWGGDAHLVNKPPALASAHLLEDRGLGRASLEAFLLPCIEQALNDTEETVLAAALGCLTALSARGLLRKKVLLEGTEWAAPLLCHPARWVQRAAVAFIATAAASLPPADLHAFLAPTIAPSLKKEPLSLSSEPALLAALKPPVPRALFDMALSSAMLSASQAFGTARGNAPGANRRPPSARESLPTRGGVPRPKGRREEYPTGGMRGNSGSEKRPPSEERLQSGADAQKTGGGELGSAGLIEQWQAVRGQEGGAEKAGEGGGGVEEDGQKLRFMEGYIKNSSSIMQQRMRNWESENHEKLQGGDGAGAGETTEFGGQNAGLQTQAGIPVYSVPLPDRRPGSRASSPPPADPQGPRTVPVNADWGLVFGVRGSSPTASMAHFHKAPQTPNLPPNSDVSWASMATAHSSMRASQHLQRSAMLPGAVPPFGGVPHPGYGEGGTAAPMRPFQPEPPQKNTSNPSKPDSDNTDPLGPLLDIPPPSEAANWRPNGVLIAHLQEHTKAVNRLSVAHDNVFFASGSDDGTVKIWDCRRLERDVSFRSKLTYDTGGGRVTSVEMLDGYDVAAATSGGTIHIARVDYVPKRPGTERERATYGGFADVRKVNPEEGAIIDLHRFDPENGTADPARLVFSTQRGGIHMWDLRMGQTAWTMRGEAKHGLLTSTALDETRGQWMVSATARGVLTLWDLRFQIPVHSWQHPLACPIVTMAPVLPGFPPQTLNPDEPLTRSNSSARPLIYVAAGQDEISLWNAEDKSCCHVFRVAQEGHVAAPPAALAPTQGSLKLQGGVRRVGSQPPRPMNPASLFCVEELKVPPARLPGTRALLPLCGGSSLLAAGSDCRIRHWDRIHTNGNFIMAGPTLRSNGQQLPQPKVESRLISRVRVTQELPQFSEPKSATIGASGEVIGISGETGGQAPGTLMAAAVMDSAGCHRDAILALAGAQTSQKILISASRDGVIKVWK